MNSYCLSYISVTVYHHLARDYVCYLQVMLHYIHSAGTWACLLVLAFIYIEPIGHLYDIVIS